MMQLSSLVFQWRSGFQDLSLSSSLIFPELECCGEENEEDEERGLCLPKKNLCRHGRGELSLGML